MPVVVITAFADVEKVKLALNGGAAHLLEKPFRAAELLAVLERVRADDRGAMGTAERMRAVLSRARLTAKERTVAAHLLNGLSSSEIAELEANSPKTIRQHVSQIYAKCGVTAAPSCSGWRTQGDVLMVCSARRRGRASMMVGTWQAENRPFSRERATTLATSPRPSRR